jgi:hypothetical protein
VFEHRYDVIFNAGPEQILAKFFDKYPNTRVLFSAEPYCWPDSSLATDYPIVKVRRRLNSVGLWGVQSGKRYLCSGLYMGHVSDMYTIMTHAPIADADDDQLYFTRIFLDEHMRVSRKCALPGPNVCSNHHVDNTSNTIGHNLVHISKSTWRRGGRRHLL